MSSRRAVVFGNRSAVLTSPRGMSLIRKTLLVVAHPDDEVVGCGSRLNHFGELTIVHVTDGAPKNMAEAARLGFASREDYRAARRRELEAALARANCNPALIELSVPDQEAAYNLDNIVERLRTWLSDHKPDLVLTHPYEGGHPDHDACSFAVHAAAKGYPIFEFTSYHAVGAAMRTGEFLPSSQPVTTVTLSEDEEQLKREMFDCFATQREMLSRFRTDVERYRASPDYDFSRRPNGGLLFYEQQQWMDCKVFLQLTQAAARRLGLTDG